MKRLLLAALLGLTASTLVAAAPAHADPTTDAACAALNLGMPPGQILTQMRHADPRLRGPQGALRVTWPIISGECGG
ncbi:hypothetical protein ACAG26_06755 [Mycobacterium sp. pUA109]|uniref:hypothetical protein n=1 Tax=Mycobacterium sp. pUA109 TaxID=3238982 RepID=UPI00351BCF1C